MTQTLDPYGLTSHKRPPPISDRIGLAFWVVSSYGRFLREVL